MRKFGTRVAIIPLLLFFFLAANLLFSPTLHAQAPFYQGKSIRFIIGSQAGSLYDLWARLIANHMGKYIAGNPTSSCKIYRRRLSDCGELNLQRCQTGWAHHRRSHSGNLYGPAHWAKGSAVRLGQIQLDRHTGANRMVVCYPRGESLQKYRRYTRSHRAAQMRLHGVGLVLYTVPKLLEESIWE